MRQFKANKLIRDKMPEILAGLGINSQTRILEGSEYLNSLKAKLIEEAKEVMSTKTQEEVLEELADVFEIMLSIANVYNVNLLDIETTANKKKAEKGGFDKKIYCTSIEMEDDNMKAQYYASKPDEYEEIQ